MAHDPNECCKDCLKPFRPTGTNVMQHPGTVAKASSKGYCTACWRKAKANGSEKSTPRPQRKTHCIDCNRPFRRMGDKVADHPGTIPHSAGGRCKKCRTQYEAKLAPIIASAPPTPEVQREREATQAWLAKMHHDAQKLERRKRVRMVIR